MTAEAILSSESCEELRGKLDNERYLSIDACYDLLRSHEALRAEVERLTAENDALKKELGRV